MAAKKTQHTYGSGGHPAGRKYKAEKGKKRTRLYAEESRKIC